MTLRYNYGPQINAKTSLVEVKLNDVALVGKRLTSINGGTEQKLKVDLPGGLARTRLQNQNRFSSGCAGTSLL